MTVERGDARGGRGARIAPGAHDHERRGAQRASTRRSVTAGRRTAAATRRRPVVAGRRRRPRRVPGAASGASVSGSGSGSQAAASWGSARAGDGATAASAAAAASDGQGLGFGDHGRLHLGVGVEQLLDRRAGGAGRRGAGSHAAASCGSARAGVGDTIAWSAAWAATTSLPRRPIRGGDVGRGIVRRGDALEQHLDRRERVEVGHRQPRVGVVRFGARG